MILEVNPVQIGHTGIHECSLDGESGYIRATALQMVRDGEIWVSDLFKASYTTKDGEQFWCLELSWSDDTGRLRVSLEPIGNTGVRVCMLDGESGFIRASEFESLRSGEVVVDDLEKAEFTSKSGKKYWHLRLPWGAFEG